MKNSIHYSKQNTAIAMSVKFAALVSLGQQTSHSLQSLCFAPCNVIYYLALLYPNVIDIFLLGFIWLGCTMRAALRYGGKSGQLYISFPHSDALHPRWNRQVWQLPWWGMFPSCSQNVSYFRHGQRQYRVVPRMTAPALSDSLPARARTCFIPQ